MNNIITTFVSISVFCQQTICKEEQLFIAILHQKIKNLKTDSHTFSSITTVVCIFSWHNWN